MSKSGVYTNYPIVNNGSQFYRIANRLGSVQCGSWLAGIWGIVESKCCIISPL
jgi:hypothetical protein